MSDQKTQSKNTLFKVYIALAILLSSAFWIFLMYSDVNYVEGSYAIQKADHPSVTGLELNVVNPTLGIQIQPLTIESEQLYYVQWEYGSIGYQMKDIPEPIINNETLGNTLQLNITIPEIEFKGQYMDFNYYSIYVYHHPSYPIALNLQGNVGSVDIDGDNIEYTKLNVVSTTGSVDVELSNSQIKNDLKLTSSVGSMDVILNKVNIAGDAKFDSTTGTLDIIMTNSNITGSLAAKASVGSLNVDLTNVAILGAKIEFGSTTGSKSINFNNIQIAQDVTIELTGSTGSLSWDWEQSKPLGGNMTITADQSTGSITTYLDFQDNIARLDVTGAADTGSVNINGNPSLSSVGSNHYRSANFGQSNLPLISVALTTSTGSITFNADM
jgi:hypothetical protein